MADQQLFDVDQALRDLARARLRRDPGTRETCTVADIIAGSLADQFSADELETAGRAIVIVASYLGALTTERIQPQVLVNILAFTGGRLVNDGRDWHAALGQEASGGQ